MKEKEISEKFREIIVTGKTFSISLTSCFEHEDLKYLLDTAIVTLMIYENDELRENLINLLKERIGTKRKKKKVKE